ncbi:MAG: ribosome biogenesis GTP-binding protein YihA/YsxC [Deltaproteobacteria bacterium]|nr:ribosome biogenesis GTP-binding protein YihA/YsxC [Deltaproteobacteria bacterium]
MRANLLKIEAVEFMRSAMSPRDFPRDGLPQVAFVGRSNVGKSSLLNRLLGRKGLARISSTPGRTRAVNLFQVNRNCYFVDLPGYGYAKAGKKDRQAWAELVDDYCQAALSSAMVVHLVDTKVGATDLDVEAFEYLASFDPRIVVVATKSDRLSRGKVLTALKGINLRLSLQEDEKAIAVSAKTGNGMNELWREIDRYLR